MLFYIMLNKGKGRGGLGGIGKDINRADTGMREGVYVYACKHVYVCVHAHACV